ncbi:ion transporter [Desulfitibacter alkalitolerans]|uniref:ion transporter n=1 Tax=Desulfitibacter alkalitolerans TaxID=264641 RepID=UPI00055215FF
MEPLRVRNENSSYIYKWSLSIVNHPFFTNFIIGIILLNAIVIGLETYPVIYKPHKELFYFTERIFLWVFSVEIALRIIATRPWYTFFKNSWNNFDFIIVASSLIFAGAHFISVLRILRVLRVLRAISVIPSLQRLVNALLSTIPSLGNILLLMGLIFYIFGVMGTILFSKVSPEYFGSLHLSLLTLFQVVTLESWASAVMRPINAMVPWAWAYFVSFVLVGTFVVINLFVGVIVNNVHQANCAEEDEQEECKREILAEEIKMLRQEIAELKQLIGTKEKL